MSQKTCLLSICERQVKRGMSFCSVEHEKLYKQVYKKDLREKKYQHTCVNPHCEESFTSTQKEAKYCSIKCQREVNKHKYASNKAGRRLKNKTRITCKSEDCSNTFYPGKYEAFYCSAKCRTLAEVAKIKFCGNPECNNIIDSKSTRKYCSDACLPKYYTPAEETRKCKNTACGKKFKVGLHRKFCSNRCRLEYYGVCERNPIVVKECAHCGEPFETNSTQKLYCSKSCVSRAEGKRRYWKEKMKPENTKKCPQCTKTFNTTSKTKVYCSAACNQEAKKAEQKRRNPIVVKKCAHCEESFETNITHKLYCSKRCAGRATRKRRCLREKMKCKNTACGKKFKVGLQRKFCSNRCRLEYYAVCQRNSLVVKGCAHCGEPFETTLTQKLYCSKRCASRAEEKRRYLRKKMRPENTKECPQCAKTFNTTRKEVVYCSAVCRLEAKKKEKNA